jgi:hypothetical protein
LEKRLRLPISAQRAYHCPVLPIYLAVILQKLTFGNILPGLFIR